MSGIRPEPAMACPKCDVLSAELERCWALIATLTAKPESLATNPLLRAQAVAATRFPDEVEDALRAALEDQPADIVRAARKKAGKWMREMKDPKEVARLIQVGEAKAVTDDYGVIGV